jgi:hypothetical protein
MLERFHNDPDQGHFGYKKTLDQLATYFYWDTIADDTRAFTTSCETCQRNNTNDFRSQGLLHPLPVPDERFKGVAIDFGTLPESHDGFNNFMVIQDRFSKLTEIIPCKSSATALQIATLLYQRWFLQGRGFPTNLISDRDPRFLSKMWLEFSTMAGIIHDLAVARHNPMVAPNR